MLCCLRQVNFMNGATQRLAPSAKMLKGRRVFYEGFQILAALREQHSQKSLLNQSDLSPCCWSHDPRIAPNATVPPKPTPREQGKERPSRPSRSSLPSPSLLEDARKTVGPAMSVHLRALPISAVTWLIHIISPGSFSLVLKQTLKRLPSWEWPGLSAPLSHAAATAHCTQSTRCWHCSALPALLCSLCPLHALDSLRPEMHKDGPMLCGKHK